MTSVTSALWSWLTGSHGPQGVVYPEFGQFPHSGLSSAMVTLGSLGTIISSLNLWAGADLKFSLIAAACSILAVSAGRYGWAGVEEQGQSQVISTLVLAILAALAGAGVVVLSSIALSFEGEFYSSQLGISSYCLLIGLGLGQGVVAIIQAAFVCRSMSVIVDIDNEEVCYVDGKLQPIPKKAGDKAHIKVHGHLFPLIGSEEKDSDSSTLKKED